MSAIVVLGGDGTNRIVARHCDADVPLCTLSTGTNNVFPEMREATVVGIATGLVVPVGVVEKKRLEPGEVVRLAPISGSLALD